LNSYLTNPERTAVDKSPAAQHAAFTPLASSMATARVNTAEVADATEPVEAANAGNPGDAEGHRHDRCVRPAIDVRSNTETAHDRALSQTSTDAARSALQQPASLQERGQQLALTRVTLASIADRLRVHLRFGKPVERQRISARCHAAFFAPESVFCRIWWEGNEYGTTLWKLSVLQAAAPRTCVQRVLGVMPGAAVLLHVHGNRKVSRVLEVIQSIEAQKVDLTDVAPSYWRTVQNRLAARAEISPFCMARHAAALLRRAIE
jgi:hypothetical protein